MAKVKIDDGRYAELQEFVRKAMMALEEAMKIWGTNFDNLYNNFVANGWVLEPDDLDLDYLQIQIHVSLCAERDQGKEYTCGPIPDHWRRCQGQALAADRFRRAGRASGVYPG